MAEDIPAYEVVEGWGRLPKGWTFTQVAGVTVDSRDRVGPRRTAHPEVRPSVAPTFNVGDVGILPLNWAERKWFCL